MSTTMHTPGPWKMVDDHDTRACLHIQAADGYHDIATIYDAPEDSSTEDENGVLRNDPVRIANARLMAAAPSLLEALDRLLNEARGFNVSGVYFGEMQSDREALDMARAAIAVATGVAQ